MDTKSICWDMNGAVQILEENKIDFLYLQPVWVKKLKDLQRAEDAFNVKMRIPCWYVITREKPLFLRMDNGDFLKGEEGVDYNRVTVILPEQGILNELTRELNFRILKLTQTGKYYWEDRNIENLGNRFWESMVVPA